MARQLTDIGSMPAAAAFLGLFALGGCRAENPHHCIHAGGDSHCNAAGFAFCNACTNDNLGCSDERPIPSCRVQDEGEESSSSSVESSSSGESYGTSEESSAAECITPDDPSCPDELPICNDGTCVSCDMVEEGCASAFPQAPLCVGEPGTCVACTAFDAGSCDAGTVCADDYTCKECTEHDHCATACDLERSTCFPETTPVVWVDQGRDDCDSEEPPDRTGAEDDPFCTLLEARNMIDAPGAMVVRLRGAIGLPVYESKLGPSGGSDDSDFILIGDGVRPVLGDVGQILTAWSGSRLMIQNVELKAGTPAMHCRPGGKIWTDDVLVRGGETGFYGEGCAYARLRRTTIVGNTGYGVQLEAGSTLRLESSVVGGNGDPSTPSVGVEVRDSSIDVVYSTIAANTGSLVADELNVVNLFCTGRSTVDVRNSVVIAEPLNSIHCVSGTFKDNFIDTEIEPTENTVTTEFNETWFRDLTKLDFHVRYGSSSEWRASAVWQIGDPLRDLDYGRRQGVPGEPDFAGADYP